MNQMPFPGEHHSLGAEQSAPANEPTDRTAPRQLELFEDHRDARPDRRQLELPFDLEPGAPR